VWEGVLEDRANNVHEQCGRAVDKILKTSVAKKTMDNITVVFVAFESFNVRGFGHYQKSSTGSSADLELVTEDNKPKGKINSLFSKSNNNQNYVVDIEDFHTTQFPKQCVSDFNFIKGRCPTPPYLKRKPKKYKLFDCPVIITTNPEELHSVP
jgi:hypothetical protein